MQEVGNGVNRQDGRLEKAPAELEQAHDRVTALLDRLVKVQEDERRRLARHLHDHLGQQVTALRLHIESLKDADRNGEDFRKRLDAIDTIAAALDRDLDSLAGELRPVALDDGGLNVALDALVEDWSSLQDRPAEFHDPTPGALRLIPETESQLYRIVQEALNNVSKHAHATCVSVRLERCGHEVLLIVKDDGVGFNADTIGQSTGRGEGLGLVSMQERAALAGGGVRIETGPGMGTTLLVRVPARTVPLSPR